MAVHGVPLRHSLLHLSKQARQALLFPPPRACPQRCTAGVQAHPRRVARVARQLEREVGTLLSNDPVRCAGLFRLLLALGVAMLACMALVVEEEYSVLPACACAACQGYVRNHEQLRGSHSHFFTKHRTGLQVLQAAVCPERRYGVDDELSAIATVTEVELSKDLAVAKIYIQIYSDPTGQDVAWDGLQRLQGCGT